MSTVAQELSAIANKTIHPYDVIKYNIEVNPALLLPGTILVVPLARGKCNAEFLHHATQCCKAALPTCITNIRSSWQAWHYRLQYHSSMYLGLCVHSLFFSLLQSKQSEHADLPTSALP